MTHPRKTIEFYFEFASPYSYLSSQVIEGLCRRRSVELAWKPIMLGPIIKRTGARPLFVDGLRGAYAKMDCERWAIGAGIPFRHWAAEPVNSLKAARGVLALMARLGPGSPLVARFIHGCFRAHFVEGKDLFDDTVLTGIVYGLGENPEDFLTDLNAGDIKQRLIEETESAFARGVFGAPTFFYDGEMFWGNDRLTILEERIALDGDPPV